MTSTIVATKKIIVGLTKAELDSIQKQFVEKLEEMLDKVRRKNEKSYCNTIMCNNVTVTLSVKNKNQRIQESITNLLD